MSNLAKARQTILAELRHAEQGAAYYESRAAALRAALEKLEQSDGAQATPARRQSGSSKSASAKALKQASKAGKRSGARKASSSRQALPKTSQAFWLGFIGQQAKTAADIANAAVASLDFVPTPEQTKQLKSRLAPTLQALLKAKKVQDTGSGRERKYKLASARATDAAKGKGAASTSVNLSPVTNGNAVHH